MAKKYNYKDYVRKDDLGLAIVLSIGCVPLCLLANLIFNSFLPIDNIIIFIGDIIGFIVGMVVGAIGTLGTLMAWINVFCGE